MSGVSAAPIALAWWEWIIAVAAIAYAVVFLAYVAFAWVMVGFGLTVLLPREVFRQLRRWRRIIRAVGDEFDDEGNPIYRDENGDRYYLIGGQRAYPLRYPGLFRQREICVQRGPRGEVFLYRRDGTPIEKRPRALRDVFSWEEVEAVADYEPEPPPPPTGFAALRIAEERALAEKAARDRKRVPNRVPNRGDSGGTERN